VQKTAQKQRKKTAQKTKANKSRLTSLKLHTDCRENIYLVIRLMKHSESGISAYGETSAVISQPPVLETTVQQRVKPVKAT
jgi:hypothetical protein